MSSSAGRRTILITGFGPFPGVAENASALLAAEVAGRAAGRFAGYRFEAATLPTEWARGPAAAAGLIEAVRPLVALHFGVSRRAGGFEIELRGHNVTCATADAAGAVPGAACLGDGTPPVLAARMPTGTIVDRLRRRGLPVRLSRDAGRYLCNAVLYNSLARTWQEGGPACCGFVHIPESLVARRPGALRPARGCPMSWNEAVDGGLEIVAACLAWSMTRIEAAPVGGALTGA